MARSSAKTRVLSDPEEIRRWAEERGAKPTCVKRTGGSNDVGIIRLDFPGYTGEDTLQEIQWDDWFQKFEESNLALLVQDTTAGGQKSNFNKLVSRETLSQRHEGQGGSRSPKRAAVSSRHSANGRSRSRSTTARTGNRRTTSRGTSATAGSSRRRASGRSSRSSRGSGASRSSGKNQRTRSANLRSGARNKSRVIARTSGKKASARSRSGSQRKAA